MNVEIITFDADPGHGGFGARVHSLVRMFSQFANVRVVLTDWFEGTRVAGVTYRAEPVSDSRGSRIRRLRTYYKTDFPHRDLRDPPDLVVVESLDLLGMHQYGPEVPVILDEHNVYWNLLRYDITTAPFFQTPVGRRPIVRRLLTPYLLRRAKRFERDAIRRANATFVTSEPDRQEVLSELPGLDQRIHVLPNCVDLDRTPGPSAAVAGNDVLFVGNFRYGPNRDAAMFVARALAPRIPAARFVLVGSSPPAGLDRLGNIETTGFVPEVDPFLARAGVCIAPLFEGSGTRLKILTYLAAGKAVVATTKACEGLDVTDGEDVLLRDREDGFATALEELLRDPDQRTRLGLAGRRLIERKYDWRVHVPWLKTFCEQLAG